MVQIHLIKKMKKPLKMRTKILALCIMSTLLALLFLTALFQNSSSELLYQQTEETTLNDLQNMQDDIYNVANTIEMSLTEIYNEESLIGDLDGDMTLPQLKEKYYNVAYDIALNYFEPSDGVSALYLFDDNKRIISTYRRAVTPEYHFPVNPYEDSSLYNTDVIDGYLNSSKTAMLISGYYNESRNKNIIRYVLKLYSKTDMNKMIGYVVCDTESSSIEKIMKKYAANQQGVIWIQPLGDRALFSIETGSEEDMEYYQEIEEILRAAPEELENNLDIGNRVLFRIPKSKYNLEAFSLVPQSLLIENQKILMENMITIAVVMLIAFAVISLVFSKSITNPLEKLSHTMDQIKKGNTKQRAEYIKDDEIGQLGKNFNAMLDEMDRLIVQKYETQILLNQAEYKALQAQINPHFLYNTLDTMCSIAQAQGNQMLSTLSQSLSNIFRYSLDMKHPLSTVAKEIIHLKNYIYVMDVRMRNEVSYQFHIDDQVLQNVLPRISLQPIVENALKHGLRNKRGEKTIEILAEIVEDTLQITVRDNGVGMDVKAANEKLEKCDLSTVEQGSSIGLTNINARVKMLFGQEYGLHIMSEPEQGTSVILRVPRKYGWEFNN